MLRRSPPPVALLALLAALGLAACGAEEIDLGPDPATLAPSEASLYVEAVVRPEGEIDDDLDEVLGNLLLTDDPDEEIARVRDDLLRDIDGGLSYEDDIAPWLGQRIGLFAGAVDAADAVEAEELGVAVVAASTDPEAAGRLIDRLAEDAVAPRSETYRGLEYRTDLDLGAAAVVGDFLVAGTEEGVRAAIDAEHDGGLSAESEFAGTVEAIPDKRVMMSWLDLEAIAELVRLGALEGGPEGASDAEEQLELLERLGVELEGTALAWGEAESDSLALTATVPSGAEPDGLGAEALGELPGDAWVALAADSLGDAIAGFLETVGDADLPGVEADELAAGAEDFERSTGVDPRELDWIGSVRAFLSGTEIPFGIGGGLLIEVADEQAAADAVASVEERLGRESGIEVEPLADGEGFQVRAAGIPGSLVELELRGGQLLVAAGAVSLAELAEPASPLSGAERYGAAAAALGEGLVPGFYLDPSPIAALIDSVAQLFGDLGTADDDVEGASRYLAAIEYLIAGGGDDGDRSTFRIVLGVGEGE